MDYIQGNLIEERDNKLRNYYTYSEYEIWLMISNIVNALNFLNQTRKQVYVQPEYIQTFQNGYKIIDLELIKIDYEYFKEKDNFIKSISPCFEANIYNLAITVLFLISTEDISEFHFENLNKNPLLID